MTFILVSQLQSIENVTSPINQSDRKTYNWWQARENIPNDSELHSFVGELGSRDGAVMRALPSQCKPGPGRFDSGPVP